MGVIRSVAMAIGMRAAAAAVICTACSSISTVRLQPDNVEVGPGLRPVAAIQADVISAYVAFVPLPGGVDLDRAVNQMLIVAAKTMGADKIVDLRFEVTPEHGVYVLRKALGWRSAHASGIAVQVIGPPVDTKANEGPEPPQPPPAAPKP
jgi:hypothetical protein